MRLAAVVREDGSTVAGLTEGPWIHVWESSGGTAKVIDNPGMTATGGGRVITLRAMLAEGVEAVCTPPGGFCTHSHKEAVRREVRFIVVDPETKVEALRAEGEALPARAVTELAPELLDQGHDHHHHHRHDHHHHH